MLSSLRTLHGSQREREGEIARTTWEGMAFDEWVLE
jgi:hypothetical protein